MVKVLQWFGFLLLIPSILINFYFLRSKPTNTLEYLVSRVIDGDTFSTKDNQRVRLLGVNSPEPEFCLGIEAKNRLDELIGGEKIQIREMKADKYGRLVAMIYFRGKSINKVMIEEGWGRYDGVNCDGCEKFSSVYSEAQKNSKGIFSPKCRQTENPANPACNIKGNIDKIDGDKTFHLPNCSEYKSVIVELDLGEKWFCNEKEALAEGFIKAKHCD